MAVDVSDLIAAIETARDDIADDAAARVVEMCRDDAPVSTATETNPTTGTLRDSLAVLESTTEGTSAIRAVGVPDDSPAAAYCVDEDTEILTRRGWTHYQDLKPHDETLTIRLSDHLSEWQRIDAVHVFPATTRRMLSMTSRAHSSLTTEEHRWPVRHRTCWDGKPDVFDLRIRYSAHLSGNDRIPRAAPCVGLPTEQKYSDDLVELVAWYYTEGTTRNVGGISICQSERVNAQNCARISRALTELFGPAVDRLPWSSGRSRTGLCTYPECGWPACRRGLCDSHNAQRRSGISLRPVNRTTSPPVTDSTPCWRSDLRRDGEMRYWILNVAAADVIRSLAPRKIPTWEFLHALTPAQLRLFVDVSMLADNNGPRAFAQKDPRRCDAFEVACLLIGYGVRRGPKAFSGVVVPDGAVAIHSSGYMCVSEARREWVAHDGPVWCPTTQNGTWLARRDGTVYFTGNSAFTDEVDTAPHEIRAVNAPVLRFFWESGRDGPGIYHFRRVHHPGTRGQRWFASKNADRWDQALASANSAYRG